MKQRILVAIWAAWLAAGAAKGAEPIIIESYNDGQNYQWFQTADGTWLESAAKSLAEGLKASKSMFNTADSTVSSARFQPDLPEAGTYEVFVTYPKSGNAKGVIIKVKSADGEKEIIQDQNGRSANASPPADQWISLGIYRFDKGTDGYVEIADPGTGVRANEREPNARVYADAVKFVPMGAGTVASAPTSSAATPSASETPSAAAAVATPAAGQTPITLPAVATGPVAATPVPETGLEAALPPPPTTPAGLPALPAAGGVAPALPGLTALPSAATTPQAAAATPALPRLEQTPASQSSLPSLPVLGSVSAPQSGASSPAALPALGAATGAAPAPSAAGLPTLAAATAAGSSSDASGMPVLGLASTPGPAPAPSAAGLPTLAAATAGGSSPAMAGLPPLGSGAGSSPAGLPTLAAASAPASSVSSPAGLAALPASGASTGLPPLLGGSPPPSPAGQAARSDSGSPLGSTPSLSSLPTAPSEPASAGLASAVESATVQPPSESTVRASTLPTSNLPWILDIGTAREAARNSGRNVLILFVAPGNRVVERLDREFFESPAMKDLLAKFVLARVSFVNNSRAAYRLGVYGAGTIAVTTPNGEPVKTVVEIPASPEDLVKILSDSASSKP